MTTTKRALIVVDVQNDFISGSLPVPGGEEVAKRIAVTMRENSNYLYDFIVTTQDFHFEPGDHWSETPDYVDTWPVHGKAYTEGAELSPHLTEVLDTVGRKFFKGQRSAAYSGFEAVDAEDGNGDAGLGEYLLQAGITDVDVVGLALDYCVKATALDAIKYGFKTRVLLGFTGAVTPEGGKAAIEELTNAGAEVTGKVVTA